VVVDLKYLSKEKDYPAEQLSALPCKKKRNQRLLKEEKEHNKFHFKKRIVLIEHTIICILKKYRIPCICV
jgi:hypothetical protein